MRDFIRHGATLIDSQAVSSAHRTNLPRNLPKNMDDATMPAYLPAENTIREHFTEDSRVIQANITTPNTLQKRLALIQF